MHRHGAGLAAAVLISCLPLLGMGYPSGVTPDVVQIPLAPSPVPGVPPSMTPLPLPSAPAPHAPAVRAVTAPSLTVDGISVLSGTKLLDVGGYANVLVRVRNDLNQPLDARLVAAMRNAAGQAVGDASGPVANVQPGETRLVELISVVPIQSVARLDFAVTTVSPGAATPTLIKLGNVHIAADDPNVVVVAVTNTDNVSHTGFISVAITAADGSILGIAFGPYSLLAAGASTVVRCYSLSGPVPPSAHLTAQVDTVI